MLLIPQRLLFCSDLALLIFVNKAKLILLLPLDCCGRFGSYIVNDAVDMLNFVYYTR